MAGGPNSPNNRQSLISIPAGYITSNFDNGIRLRNDIYELKKELCLYLLNIFDQFLNDIDTDLRNKYKVSVEDWPVNRKLIKFNSHDIKSIILAIKRRQTPYIQKIDCTKKYTRSVAEDWAESNSSVLASCFIKQDLLVDNGYKFSFDSCDPAQLLSVYQNYNKFSSAFRGKANDVRKVRDRCIAHLRKLDEVTNTLYTVEWGTIDRFRRCLV